MTQQTPAGWYPQPDGSQRYWNGVQWTDHSAPAATSDAPPPPPAPGVAPGVADTRQWFKKKRFIIPGAALAVIIVGSVASGKGDAADVVATPTPSVTAAPSVESPSPTPTPTPAAEVTFTVPDLVGANLQDAQDLLQSLGSYTMDQTDASGLDRMQVNDSNWQVCAQEPAAGTEVSTDTVVTLAAVKLDESCDGEAAEDPKDEAEVATFEVPDLVGMNLQYAQDTLQSLGSYAMDQTDASGLGRMQVNDSNWQVCAQDPAPGKTVSTDTVITLAAVKLDESC